MKKLIINADDFGYSVETNEAIKFGYQNKVITSTSIITNLEGFEHAINEILPQIPQIDIGIHLNIIEGKSLTESSLLCNSNGYFKNNYVQILLKSKDKNFLSDVEKEFRAQIEKAQQYCKISHIDSHVHTHSIPAIFDLTTKLAKEYNIKFIRTQNEIPYIVFDKLFCPQFYINIIKNLLLNILSFQNKKKLKNTNNYFIGVLYTGMMNKKTILNGLKKIKKDNSITEVIFHPSFNKQKINNFKELQIVQNPNFEKEIQNLGFTLSCYSDI